MKTLDFKRGFNDGKLSANRLIKPIHVNWKKDKSNKSIHFNKEYLKGYKAGFKSVNGLLPLCLS